MRDLKELYFTPDRESCMLPLSSAMLNSTDKIHKGGVHFYNPRKI